MVASASMTEAAVAMAVAALLTRIVIAVAVRGSILAIPNQRSSHALPTPTMGGVAIALPVLAWCGYRIGQDPLCWAALGGGGMLAVLGLADDLRDLSARVRLPIQGIAVAVALSALPIAIPLVLPPISIQMPWLVVGLDFLIVLWMVNLYNFMDGIDGLATSQCVVYCAGVLLIGHPVAFTSELLVGIARDGGRIPVVQPRAGADLHGRRRQRIAGPAGRNPRPDAGCPAPDAVDRVADTARRILV